MNKELIEQLRTHNDDRLYFEADVLMSEAADLIESLEQNARDADRMYKELEGELAEQQKRIEELEADTKEVNAARIYLREQERLLRQLAAAGADNKRLRDALEAMVMYAKAEGKGLRIADEALAQPTDDSALRELLKAERERCAKVADEWQTAIHDPRYQCDCAKAILAMEDQ